MDVGQALKSIFRPHAPPGHVPDVDRGVEAHFWIVDSGMVIGFSWIFHVFLAPF